MNRVVCILPMLIGLCNNAKAQPVSFGVMSSNNYTAVRTYDGQISPTAYVLRFQYSGTSLNIPDWKTSVRVKQVIGATDGTEVFPADKISLRVSNTVGQAQPYHIPSVNEIGIPPLTALHESQEVFLVPQSNAPLYNSSAYNSYYDLRINFDLVIAGGAYLTGLQGGDRQKRYLLVLEFRAYGPTNELLGMEERTYTIDVFRLTGVPPANPYTIQIAGDAQHAVLELKSMADYTEGANVVYTDGLTVTSETDYQINVRAVTPAFSTHGGETLPLGVVGVELLPSTDGASTPPIHLATMPQKVAEGDATVGASQRYHISYFTSPADMRLFQSESGMAEYEAILEYEIIPK